MRNRKRPHHMRTYVCASGPSRPSGTVSRPSGGDAAVVARMRRAGGLVAREYYALAGFFDAEGHFAISGTRQAPGCAASIALRDDDAQTLLALCRGTGLGRVTGKAGYGGSCPQARWMVGTKRECSALAAVLGRYRLLGRKRREVEVWSRAVRCWKSEAGPFRNTMLRSHDLELRRLRKYDTKTTSVTLEEPSWSRIPTWLPISVASSLVMDRFIWIPRDDEPRWS